MKIKLAPWVLRLAYNLVDVESLGESSVFEQRTLEYGYAISRLCNLFPGRLMDIGCTARINPIPSTFCGLGWQVKGIDLREYNYKHPNFLFLKADLLNGNLSMFNGSIDAITCISTLEHMGLKRYGSRERGHADLDAMASMRELLHTNGFLILTVPYSNAEQGYTTKLEKVYGWKEFNTLSEWSGLSLTHLEEKPGLFLSTWRKK